MKLYFAPKVSKGSYLLAALPWPSIQHLDGQDLQREFTLTTGPRNRQTNPNILLLRRTEQNSENPQVIAHNIQDVSFTMFRTLFKIAL